MGKFEGGNWSEEGNLKVEFEVKWRREIWRNFQSRWILESSEGVSKGVKSKGGRIAFSGSQGPVQIWLVADNAPRKTCLDTSLWPKASGNTSFTPCDVCVWRGMVRGDAVTSHIYKGLADLARWNCKFRIITDNLRGEVSSQGPLLLTGINSWFPEGCSLDFNSFAPGDVAVILKSMISNLLVTRNSSLGTCYGIALTEPHW